MKKCYLFLAILLVALFSSSSTSALECRLNADIDPTSRTCNSRCVTKSRPRGPICIRACEKACCGSQTLDTLAPYLEKNQAPLDESRLLSKSDISILRELGTQIKAGLGKTAILKKGGPASLYTLGDNAKELAAMASNSNSDEDKARAALDLARNITATLYPEGSADHIYKNWEMFLFMHENMGTQAIEQQQKLKNESFRKKNGWYNCKDQLELDEYLEDGNEGPLDIENDVSDEPESDDDTGLEDYIG